MAENEPTLLMISDIEGCLELRVLRDSNSNGIPVDDQGVQQPDNPLIKTIKQNIALCKTDTYISGGPLFNFLNINKQNKIAFLGDYFDQGTGVYDSINGIVSLKKEFYNRVHIILGNRDINKFRLAYEVNINRVEELNETYRWGAWKNFYNLYANYFNSEKINNSEEINNSDDKKNELLNIIIENSFGPPNAFNPKNSNPELKQKVFGLKHDLPIINILKVFNSDGDNDIFAKNCRYLYNNAKIITYDKEFNVLLSHGGGYHKYLFYSPYSLYEKCYNESEKEENYFNKIEIIRRNLQVNTSFIGEFTKTSDINTLILKINNPLDDFLKEFYERSGESEEKYEYFVKTDNVNPPKQHYLLQALGLKPDSNDHQFLSFIQSCGQNSCSGIRDSIVSNPSDKGELIDLLYEYGIRNVAHGHVPHCIPQPLIYYREGNSKTNTVGEEYKVIFIANDTSNGNRSGSTTLDELPLSYIKIRDDTFAYGVSSVTNDGKLSDTNTYKGDSDATSKTMFTDFVKEFKYEDVKSDVEVNDMIEWMPKSFNAKRKATTGGKTRRNRLTKSKNFKKANRRSRKPNKRSIKKSTCGCRH